MKKIIFLFLSMMIISFSLNAIVLPEGTDAKVADLKTFENGKISEVLLAEPTVLNTSLGKVESIGVVKFTASGKISSFIPAKEGSFNSPIGEIKYVRQRRIDFYKSGCPKALLIYGESNITYGRYSLSINDILKLNDNWKPYSVISAKVQPLSFPCGNVMVEEDSLITFYSSGEIYNLKINEPAKISTIAGSFHASGNMEISKSGYPIYAKISAMDSEDFIQTSVGKIKPPKDTYIGFYNSGEIKNLFIPEVMEIKIGNQSFYAKANTELGLSKKGSVIMATVAGNKPKFYNWNIELYKGTSYEREEGVNYSGDEYTFIIFPKNRVYIKTMIKSVNGKSISAEGILLEKDFCYCASSSIRKYNNDMRLIEEKYQLHSNGRITVKLNDHIYDFSNTPILLDDEGNIIGYKFYDYIEYLDPRTDRYEYKLEYKNVHFNEED